MKKIAFLLSILIISGCSQAYADLSFKEKIAKRRAEIAAEMNQRVGWGDKFTGEYIPDKYQANYSNDTDYDVSDLYALIDLVRKELIEVVNLDDVYFKVTNDNFFFMENDSVVAMHSFWGEREWIFIRSEVTKVYHAVLAHEIAHTFSLQSYKDWPTCESYVTEYASRNIKEDFSESFAVYRYGGVNMRVMAKKDKCIQSKYEYMEKLFGDTFNTYLPMGAYSTAEEGSGSVKCYR